MDNYKYNPLSGEMDIAGTGGAGTGNPIYRHNLRLITGTSGIKKLEVWLLIDSDRSTAYTLDDLITLMYGKGQFQCTGVLVDTTKTGAEAIDDNVSACEFTAPTANGFRCLLSMDGVYYSRTLETVYDDVFQVASAGGGGGTGDYAALTNKPSINGVELIGNKTATDLGIGPTFTSVTIAETDWGKSGDTYTCVKTLSGVTTTSNVVATPDGASMVKCADKQAYLSALGSNSVTFTANTDDISGIGSVTFTIGIFEGRSLL